MPQNNPTLSAFVIMCFDDKLSVVYERVIKPVLEAHEITCIRSDKDSRIGVITDQIEDYIQRCQLIICDLTYNNPNVFYELGIAVTLKKFVILISQSAADAPFDVSHYKIIEYQNSKIGLLDLRDALAKYIVELFPDHTKLVSPKKNLKLTISHDDIKEQRMSLLSSSIQKKRYAIKYLGDIRDKESFDTIKRLIGLEKDIDLLRDAFTALCNIDKEQAKPILLNEGLRNQPEYMVRERVVNLMSNYTPDDDLIQHMVDQISDTSWGVRKSICDVFDSWSIRKESILSALESLLMDDQQMVRYAARNALEQISSQTVLEKVEVK